MNRNCYRLVFNPTLGTMVPAAETARRMGKAASSTVVAGVMLAGVALSTSAFAELPRASTGAAGMPAFVTHGQAATQTIGNQMNINQVGNAAILNWQSFNVSAGNTVQFRQVDNLTSNNLVQGASFTTLNRIHDINPSVIAGRLTQGAGQKANVIMVNSNGIAFMGGSQVNLNSFTASTLNIRDSLITDGLLSGANGIPQFEGALDGGPARGFIKVFEGAQITAGQFGRVMLIAPTVVNRGIISAPDGQIITAAATRVLLRAASAASGVRGLTVEVDVPTPAAGLDAANTTVQDGVLDGNAVALRNEAEDKLGHVTNLGTLLAERGNITMVGHAVNQIGIARATSSVTANGSVYLVAAHRNLLSNADATEVARGGRVTLGSGSKTEVLPEVADTTGALDGATKPSVVSVTGQDIRMAGGATINVAAGTVEMVAVDNPNALGSASDPLTTAGTEINGVIDNVSNTARIHIAAGARINVAGIENAQVSAARNAVAVELRGDELKDSPVNRNGVLRGEKVYVDIDAALTNAKAGKSTLIAKDSLESYQRQVTRDISERSTQGGTVTMKSQGELIVQRGATIDLSGGSVKYTAANVKTTLLTTNGKSVDIANATADTKYDGISTRVVVGYDRWNKQEVIDLGQSYKYDPGYTQGQDAGALNLLGMKAMVMQGDVQGRTTTGERQAAAGITPRGAQVTIGRDNAADKKLNQQVVFSSAGARLPTGFTFGSALPDDLTQTLMLNPTLLGSDKVAELNVYSNQAAEVREALRAPQGGSVSVTAKGVEINANVTAQAGKLNFVAEGNGLTANATLPGVTVADGVALTAHGNWVNNLPNVPSQTGTVALVDGGIATLKGPSVVLGRNTVIDVSGGGSVSPNGAVKAGNGGNVVLQADANLSLGGDIRGYALGQGGTLSVAAAKVQVGGPADPTALNLEAGFFERGGFANFNVTGTTSLNIANGTVLRPTVLSRELVQGYNLQATGSNMDAFTRIAKRDDRVRQSANVSFRAPSKVEGEGVVRLGEGAQILADAQAKVAFEAGNRVELLGQVRAKGGIVSAKVGRGGEGDAFNPSAMVYVGERAVLDVSGTAQTYTDSRGLTQGKVLAGGTVELSGQGAYVVTQAGSTIDLRGAGPTTLGVPNEAGGLGRTVGSDAGTLKVATSEGAMLDGLIQAQPTSAGARGGTLEFSQLGGAARATNGSPLNERVLTLSNNTAPQAAGVVPGASIALAVNGNTELNVRALEAAGFDRMKFESEHAIRVAAGVALGANRALPMRALEFSAGRIEGTGGNAAVSANYVRFSNAKSITAPAPVVGVGTLTANAQLLEVAGNVTFSGIQTTELTGAEEVRLSGGGVLAGSLNTASNLVVSGGVIAPATAVNFTVNAPDSKVEFKPTTAVAPDMPYSAFGSLTVNAKDIAQDGNVWAPLGQVNLNAKDTLVLTPRSLTSVAATGALLPYGRIENGRKWVYGADGSKVEVSTLPSKAIRTTGTTVDQQQGARVDVRGGGDFQAYEFTAGPGGSRDILADKNTYAILPSYKGKFAPTDAQEGFDRVAGEQVYLSGVPNLAAGYYTLLPAHYALLPGAYAVRLDTGVKDLMPGQAYTRQDGVRVAPGYLADSRTNAPRDANWQGIQVLTGAQVRERSEYTLVRGSEFFADARNRPQDAGVMSITTTGVGADSLKLNGTIALGAAPSGNRGAVDISAQNLVVTGSSAAGVDPNATQIGVDKLNALGAGSLMLGGTRAVGADGTTLQVDAQTVTLANGGAAALQAGEVILAAQGTLTLGANSAIDAQGAAGDAGTYNVVGNGALVRAASTTANLVRTGTTVNAAQGVLVGSASSTVRASDSIHADATGANSFASAVQFGSTNSSGSFVANPLGGNLAVGASGINFVGANASVPVGATGITYTQAQLDVLKQQRSLAFTSYSSFDMVGDVTVEATQNLTLQGAGLKGVANAGQTATLKAQNITLSNAGNASTSAAAAGNGTLNIEAANKLTLGAGDKRIEGFTTLTAKANELVGAGKGTTTIAAPTTVIEVARIRGERGADQTLTAQGTLDVTRRVPDRTLDTAVALGSSWTLKGTSVNFDTQAVLPSGSFKLEATGSGANDHVTLGSNANVDVAGRTVQFFDVAKPTWGGTVTFTSANGNVSFAPSTATAPGAKVNVSGADGGTLQVSAVNGTATLPGDSVQGTAVVGADGKRGDGARAQIDVGTLASYSDLNTALNNGGFEGERDLRVRSGDVVVASGDTTRAKNIRIAADGVNNGGALTVNGTLDASGGQAGRVALFGKGNVTVGSTAQLNAISSGAGKDGGTVELGTQGGGALNMVAGSQVNVSGGAGGRGGTVQLRAERIATDVNVTALNSTITGARSVDIEAVRVYNNINTLNTTGAGANALSLATVTADNTAFAGNQAAIKARLGKTGDANFHVLSGVEVRSAGDLTLANDWNMSGNRAGGEAGVLTVRADGRVNINNNLSDGFNVATPCTVATCPTTNPVAATLLAGKSWSYRLVSGADQAAADVMAVKAPPTTAAAGAADFTLAAGKLIRTGTGDIRIASGGDIRLASDKSAIYTAGTSSGAVAGFTNPVGAQYSQDGGNVSLRALGNVSSATRSQQLYSNWLYRQGRLDATQTAYITQPSWWVRFDKFEQGVATLGGGDVTIQAGGKVENLSASAATQARTQTLAGATAGPDASTIQKTGGGSVRVETGTALLGGQYYADNGELVLKAGSTVADGQAVGATKLYTVLALGDAQARVQARDDVNVHAIINPHVVIQSSGANSNLGTTAAGTNPLLSTFSTYSDTSKAELSSLTGNVNFHNQPGGRTAGVASTSGSQPLAAINANGGAYGGQVNFGGAGTLYVPSVGFGLLPGSLALTAFQGDVLLDAGSGTGVSTMRSAPTGNLALLAAGSVKLRGTTTMSDTAPVPDALNPARSTAAFSDLKKHAAVPVHAGDAQPVRIYAVDGDVQGEVNKQSLVLPKSFAVKAGRDVRDVGITAQNIATTDVSSVDAGRDFAYSLPPTDGRTAGSYIQISGPGRLEVTSGRDIDLGTSAGLISRGNVDNLALPAQGASIQVAAGVGAGGIDYSGALDRLQAKLDAPAADDTSLWHARWLTGNSSLSQGDAAQAVRTLRQGSAENQRNAVRAMLFTALKQAGSDSLDRDSAYAGNYSRGYAAIELLFPKQNVDGSARTYKGDINLFASRILTEAGGNIEFMAPGGKVIVGLPNTSQTLLATQVPGSGTGLTDAGALGIVVASAPGDVQGFADSDVLVNQARIFAVGGGDVLLWSSEGDIDAGKGAKTASVVPPPLNLVDAQGNVTRVLQGAATGSGIGALPTPGSEEGNGYLFAPKGTINAGDAGIRAGKLVLGAVFVRGTGNIAAKSVKGPPPPNTSALAATASGATSAGNNVSGALAALNEAAADSAKNAQSLKDSFKPTFVRVDVLGYGE